MSVYVFGRVANLGSLIKAKVRERIGCYVAHTLRGLLHFSYSSDA